MKASDLRNKLRHKLRNKLALVVGLSIIILSGVIVYASTTLILAVGTIPNSQLFDGPATVTVRTLTINPGEVLAWTIIRAMLSTS